MLLQQNKWLTFSLILSVALNIGLISTFVYQALAASAPVLEYKGPDHTWSQSSITNAGTIRYLAKLSKPELADQLLDKTPVEDGFFRRDLVLGVLVSIKRFDLKRCIGTLPEEHRDIRIAIESKDIALRIYPSLSDEQFKQVSAFAQKETYWQNTEGLFESLAATYPQVEPSLKDAFVLTEEFIAVRSLLNAAQPGQASSPLTNETILNLLTEGTWPLLSAFSESQQLAADNSVDKRRELLVQYLGASSKTAATLLLADADYSLHKLDDTGCLKVLNLADSKTPAYRQYARDLLLSVRSNTLWKAAASKLYELEGAKEPEKFDRQEALKRFRLNVETKPTVKSTPAGKQVVHTVKEGDSLWKIANRYKANIDSIRKQNKLKNDTLVVGKQLVIPL